MKFKSSSPLVIGTRGSPLALAQAHETMGRLIRSTGLDESCFKIKVIKTTGDKIQDRPLSEVGGKGLFTKEIEEAMLDNNIDIAVHSMKDMPVICPEGLIISCYLPREDVRDSFISTKYKSISELPNGATVGTSSLRRRAQLLNKRPDLKIVEFRGNVQTRLRKLNEGIADATFLACAGLNRLGRNEISNPIETDDMLPAIAQGCIGIEQRKNDIEISKILSVINDKSASLRLAAERSLLLGLDGSCQTPIAGLAELNGQQMRLRGEVIRPDGSEVLQDEITCPVSEGVEMATLMAKRFRSQMGENFF
ncbi:hydroxymethylbilane synthase [Amylibacter sp.]|jgi:hydroxymethylbilane synthase|nr:hydroxymethylbilane synthase [Amylibacter sp.]MDB4233146.1 hydroxymethylbilane synthase [bacterium]MDA8853384.1 hydroxymethylbilane synthase [Amylibacter sp.]MDA8914448.1 hydroxymethylbilane synthase [Amylibacter sp.]MDA9005064.1 hydroxymethylbilane synthase [Amylibacter sp.]|tara:strand:+ start:3525 stop:4448 length:924 start_codon:yes stop_codon:yes gene_type:complete